MYGFVIDAPFVEDRGDICVSSVFAAFVSVSEPIGENCRES